MSWMMKGFITFNAVSLPASASWSVDLGGQPSYSLVVGGTVYVAASVNGNSQLSALSGTNGAPAATVDGIYVAPVCYAIDLQPATGTILWANNTGCSGGGGNTPAVGSGVMYAPLSPGYYAGNVYATETGQVLGSFSASAPPAISTTSAFIINNSTLQGIALTNNQVLWSFAGDGALTNSPVVVDNYVFIGSTNGNLYALDATSGAQLWTKNLGAPITGPATGGNANQGATGLSAGDGLLIVPAGNNVIAYVLSTNP
jgi:outer membrane protein assembly factor BamB